MLLIQNNITCYWVALVSHLKHLLYNYLQHSICNISHHFATFFNTLQASISNGDWALSANVAAKSSCVLLLTWMGTDVHAKDSDFESSYRSIIAHTWNDKVQRTKAYYSSNCFTLRRDGRITGATFLNLHLCTKSSIWGQNSLINCYQFWVNRLVYFTDLCF